MKSKGMLSSISNITHLIVFIVISFNIIFMTKNTALVCCQEIPSSVESIKQHIPSNLTVTSEDVSRIDRSHHDNEIENKFFIKANTIIRTGESRALGAKYLNETRLLSNHDCLTWCLETPTCNAAVYEEKNMQSCYMFDCGSPAKPLCKFTSHNFFTSSLLKMSQHSYELSQWGRQVQQERGSIEHKSDVIPTTSEPEIINMASTSTVPPVSYEQQQGKKGSICHHYQFQCVNTSECIAIYNVCDGIPQCPDGSDESSELKCPTKGIPEEVPNNKNKVIDARPTMENKTPVLKQEPPSIHPSAPYTGQNVPPYKKPAEHKEIQHKDNKGIWPGSYSGPSMTKTVPQYHHHLEDSDGLGSPFIHKHSQFISANDPHVQNLNRWANDYDQYPSHSTSLEQQYGPYDRIDEQYLSNQMPADYDTGKSFTGYHQEDIPYWPSQDILQDNSYTVDEFPQPGVQNLNKVIGYPDKESSYAQQITRTGQQYPETKLSMHSKPLLKPNQPSDMDDYKLRRYPHSRQQQPYIGLEDSLQQHYSNYPEMKTKGFNSMPNADDTLYNNDDLIRASIVNQLPKKLDQIHHQTEHEIKHLSKDMLHPISKEKNGDESTQASRDNSFIIVKPTLHPPPKSIQRTVLDFKMSVAELYQSSSTHTHETNSAILALVLGITISFFLIILLTCRMKTLRRRMSRKGRSLAHDADYLVNGMYL